MEGFCLVGIGSAVTEGFGMARRVLVGFGSPGSDWQVVTSSGKARLGRKFAKDWIVEVWRGPARLVLADTVRR